MQTSFSENHAYGRKKFNHQWFYHTTHSSAISYSLFTKISKQRVYLAYWFGHWWSKTKSVKNISFQAKNKNNLVRCVKNDKWKLKRRHERKMYLVLRKQQLHPAPFFETLIKIFYYFLINLHSSRGGGGGVIFNFWHRISIIRVIAHPMV